MKKDIEEDFARAVASRINIPISKYLEARVEELKNELTVCREEVFKLTQGRVLEVIKLLEIVKKSRG